MAPARGLLLVLAAAAAACLMLARPASAARLEAQGVHTVAASTDTSAVAASMAQQQAPAESRLLCTFWMSVTKPQLQLSSAGGATRPGRTALTVMLSGPAAVSAWMPVVSPRHDGMTHDVVHTWAALKNYALMFARVNAVNKQAAPGATRLFPVPSVAVQAASDVSPFGKLDVDRIIDTAEAQGRRCMWAEPSPGSALLLPHGSSTAAVADVMNIAHDEQSGAISLDLELVYRPHIVSEFEAHGKQSLDAHEAHYHFATPPGVVIDAAGLLASLQDARLEVAGLHVFVKGFNCGYTANLTTNATTVPVGQVVRINIDADSQCPERRIRLGAGVPVDVSVTAPGTIVGASPDTTPEPTRAPVRTGQTAKAYTDSNGRAWVDVLVQGTGPIKVSVDSINNGSPTTPASISITGVGGSAPAKLLLTPHKARRHVHQHASVTAVALDANDSPVAGVLVAFSAFGDCQPLVHPTAAVTNDKGWATVHLTGHEPGAVAVVAATVGANGATVTSPASHIIWVDEEHGDERDGYYGRDAQSYADAAARLAAAEVTKATTAAAATPNAE